MIIGFLSGLFIAAVAGVAVMSLLLLQRKRGMSYDNNRESYRCREPKTITEFFDGIKSSICDNYCKYPGEIKDYDELIETVCSKCPLRKLN